MLSRYESLERDIEKVLSEFLFYFHSTLLHFALIEERIFLLISWIPAPVVEPGGFRTGIWEETEREVQKRAGSRYDSAYHRTLQGTRLAQPMMGAPGQVAKVIASALSGFTRPRYLVGYDAAAISLWSRLTPTEIKDRLSRLVLGL